MATLLKGNAIFIHVPKTGGTFLRTIFEKMNLIQFDFGRDHADMERVINVSNYYPGNYLLRSFQLRKNLEAHVRKCYKFAFVRHPFDWYESYWRFMQDHQWNSFTDIPSRTRFGFPQDTWHPFLSIEKYGNVDFNVFVENIIKYEPGFLTKLYDRYTNPEHINYIGKQETLKDDIQYIFDELKIQYDSTLLDAQEKINPSITPKPSWDKNHKEIIHNLEKNIFKKYGYDYK